MKPDARKNHRKTWLGVSVFLLLFLNIAKIIYLTPIFRYWFAITITDRMGWWKVFFLVWDFSCWIAAREIGRGYTGTLDITYHHAWATPSLVHHHPSVSPNSFRATGTEDGGTQSRKRCWCIGAHYSEELFWSLRRRTPGALGHCVNRFGRRPWIMS